MSDKQNHHAHTILGKEIKISEAESGANGYFCIGCGARMIAHKGLINEHFFRHHPEDIDLHNKCEFSDETYRHKVSKEILQRLKRIKVKDVLGQFTDKVGTHIYEISPARFIEAHSVQIEVYIYENEKGQINFSHSFDKADSKKYLLIKPDIVFLDAQGIPILLIEIRSTNKVAHEKLAKLQRLGVDAIEVMIPPFLNSEEIEKLFFVTSHTKWLYSVNQNEKYDSSKHRLRKRSGQVDIDESELHDFDETYACRKFRLREALRAIRRLMEQAEFSKQQEYFDSEISRVERNTKENTELYEGIIREERLRIEQIKADIRREIESVISASDTIRQTLGEEIVRAREYIDRAGKNPGIEIRRKEKDLEERYFNKGEKLTKQQKKVTNIYNGYPKRIDKVKEFIQRSEASLDKEYYSNQNKFDRKIEDITQLQTATTKIEREFFEEERIFRKQVEPIERQIGRIRELIQRIASQTQNLSKVQDEAIRRRSNKRK